MSTQVNTKKGTITFYSYDWKDGPDILLPDMIELINTPNDVQIGAREIKTDADYYLLASYPDGCTYTDKELLDLYYNAEEYALLPVP